MENHLGFVIKITSEGFVFYEDENLTFRELSLLEGKEYEPKRTFKGSGTWALLGNQLSLTMEDSVDNI